MPESIYFRGKKDNTPIEERNVKYPRATGTVSDKDGVPTGERRKYTYIRRRSRLLAGLVVGFLAVVIFVAGFIGSATATEIQYREQKKMMFLAVLISLAAAFGISGSLGLYYLSANITAGTHTVILDATLRLTAVWQRKHQRFRLSDLSRDNANETYYLYRDGMSTWVLTPATAGDWLVTMPAKYAANVQGDIRIRRQLSTPPPTESKATLGVYAKFKAMLSNWAMAISDRGTKKALEAQTKEDVSARYDTLLASRQKIAATEAFTELLDEKSAINKEMVAVNREFSAIRSVEMEGGKLIGTVVNRQSTGQMIGLVPGMPSVVVQNPSGSSTITLFQGADAMSSLDRLAVVLAARIASVGEGVPAEAYDAVVLLGVSSVVAATAYAFDLDLGPVVFF